MKTILSALGLAASLSLSVFGQAEAQSSPPDRPSSSALAADYAWQATASQALEGDTGALASLLAAANIKNDGAAAYGLGYYFKEKMSALCPCFLVNSLVTDAIANAGGPQAPPLCAGTTGAAAIKCPEIAEFLNEQVIYFTQGAAAGDKAAEAGLGNLYFTGALDTLMLYSTVAGPTGLQDSTAREDAATLRGLENSCSQAVAYLQDSVNAGWPPAMVDLALLYSMNPQGRTDTGSAGCALADPVQGQQLLTKAADLGDTDALLELIMNQLQEGQDPKQSLWLPKLEKIAQGGNIEAQQDLEVVQANMK